METLWQDIRYGIRMLARKPGFTAVAVLTLALGIGANTAIFSVVNAVLLQPFPYKDSDRLVMVWETNLSRGLNLMYADPPSIVDWRERSNSFEDMAIFVSRSFFLSQESEALRVPGARVSANLFDLLGVAPLHGRVFTPEEDQPDAGTVVLLSYALWQNRFGGDPAVVGKTFTINEAAYLVTGVMPEGFDFPPPIALEGDALPETPDLWAPLAYNLQASNRGAHHLTVIARLKNSVSIAQAETEMQGIARQMEKEFPGTNRGWSIDLVPLQQQVVGESRPALITLLAAVGLVLLIGCVNIANLLAARNAGRQKEFAIRSALGASRLRIAWQLMVESLVLALLGGVAGVLLAFWGLDLLVSVAPSNVPRLSAAQMDSSVLGFAAFLSLLTGLLFGLAPALQTAASDLFATLKEGGRTGAQGERVRSQSALVVAEVALSLLLLVGAGLFLQSFLYLQGIDPGFEADKVLTMRVRLPQTRYPGAEERAGGFRQFEEQLNLIEGVEAAGFTFDIPLGADRQGTSFQYEGEPEPDPSENRLVNFTFVTPGYFRAMGIPLSKGRMFTQNDTANTDPVVIVNEAFVRKFGGAQDPLERKIFVNFRTQTPARIVGVVGAVRHDKVHIATFPAVYVPHAQAPVSSMTLAVRSTGDPIAILSVVRQRIQEIEPLAPIYNVRTMSQVVGDSMAQSRFLMFLLVLFAAVALLLAAVGIYGVISYSVSQRMHEMGIRIALGAQSHSLFRLIFAQGMAPVLTGMVIGSVAAFVLSRFLESMLFGVSAADPVVFLSVAGLLTAVALLACYIPARRATEVDPMVALRYE